MVQSCRTIAATARRALQTALAVPAMISGLEVESETARLLHEVIECDEILLTEIRLPSGAEVRAGPTLVPDLEREAALSRIGHLHPAVLSYLEPGDGREPRRLSDVIGTRTWLSGRVYVEAFRESGGKYQLSLVTSLDESTGRGWVLLRDAKDFTVGDVEKARMLLPQVAGLAEIAKLKRQSLVLPCADAQVDAADIQMSPASVKSSCPGSLRAVGKRPIAVAMDTANHASIASELTAREGIVLELLGTGASARQISRTLGITESTTRKHLQHIYAKLGVHDRLTAVLWGSDPCDR